MDHPKVRIGGGVLGWLLSTGLTVSGLVVPPVGYALLVLMLPVSAWTFWPWIKRWRPFTLAPIEGGSPPITETGSTDTDSHQKQEDEIKRLEGVIRKQQERLNRFDGDRLMFKTLLDNAWDKGTRLREGKPDKEEALEWEHRVRNLLQEALGDDWADRILNHDPAFRSGMIDPTSQEKWMESRLNRLRDNLIRLVESKDYIPFRSGFDPHDYDPTTLALKKGVVEERDAKKEAAYWENRRLLKRALSEAYKDGLFWRNTGNNDATNKWADRTRRLIEAALGRDKANLFLSGAWGRGVHEDAEENRKWVDARLNPLHELLREVDSVSSLKLEPDFDAREWVSER